MCGIFGIVSNKKVDKNNLKKLVFHSQQRGKDSSGLITYLNNRYIVNRADYEITKLLQKTKPYNSKIVFGHSRLVTNGMKDNQPVIRNGIICIHNGIIVNEDEIWEMCSAERELQIDSEAIIALCEYFLSFSNDIKGIAPFILSHVKGIVACALLIPNLGKLILFSNNGSLYT